MINSVVQAAVGTPVPVGDATNTIPTARADAFETAMSRQGVQNGADVDPVHVAAAPGEVAKADVDAESRARRGLNLDGAERREGARTDGDMILDGMERIRGVFDAREARISELMTRNSIDAASMMAMQMEVANFTLLVDMTSKLTGKSTQVFDTLMKGQ